MTEKPASQSGCLIIFVSIGGLFVLIILLSLGSDIVRNSRKKEPSPTPNNIQKSINPEAFILKFGKPDKILNGLKEKPLPLMPVVTLIYRQKNVQFLFVTDNKPGAISEKEWVLAGSLDLKKKPLDPDEAFRRLEKNSPTK
jgi:hypothetical protein